MSRPIPLILLALCAGNVAASPENGSGVDIEEPPQVFPTDNAQPFNSEKLRPTSLSSEAIDMNKNVTVIANETYEVDHPKVKDPGTTHEEKREGRGTIQACAFPDPGSASSASDWLADSGHVSKLANLCKLPSDLLNSTTGMLRICSIPKDVWDSAGNNITSGTVPKELLTKLNAPNVSCVTPRSNSRANKNDTIVTGSIPSVWLLGNNDTIYIYIIPREWLNQAKSASEVEDLTRDPELKQSVTTAPIDLSATDSVDTSHFNEPSSQIPPSQSSSSTALADASSEFTTSYPVNNFTENSMNTIDPSTSVDTTDLSTRTRPDTEIYTSTSSMQNASTTASPTSAHGLTDTKQYTTEVQKIKYNFKTTDRPKKYITSKPFEKPTLSRKPFHKSETLSSTPQYAITTHNSTGVPISTTTEISKEELPTLVNSHSENEIAHSAPKSAPLSQSNNDHDLGSSSGKKGFLQPTESAAILAGVFVAIALLGYAGLLLWRRVLEKRYGNREMLVNEDDDFDTSDLHHFEL